jgi:hypothetical protein
VKTEEKLTERSQLDRSVYSHVLAVPYFYSAKQYYLELLIAFPPTENSLMDVLRSDVYS